MDKEIAEVIQLVSKWVGDNPLTILLIGNVIQFLYQIAGKTKTKADDKAVNFIARIYRKITGREVLPEESKA